jgi:hypothetical protein
MVVTFLTIFLSLLLVVQRRLPFAAVLPLPIAVVILWKSAPRSGLLEALIVAGGISAASVAVTPIFSWLLMRLLFWLPDRLSEPEDRDERGATARLKALAELGRLGFRPAGALAIPRGLERRVLEYFTDTTGTITAWINRHWIGISGLTFCSEQDGARLETTNYPSLPLGSPPPGWTIFYHHFCATSGDLLRKHREHLASLAIDLPDPCPDVPARERRRYEEEIGHLVQSGQLVPDRRGRLRMTLRAVVAALPRAFFSNFRRKSYRLGR